ncbi:permease prefix domain 1-containing protein [Clostridium tertium]|uniref:permease prefix domain 1-containing protein n=1 Tax=Clostridium tertium TaxID=1559 RepID=UPI00232EF9CF|nr:permease prefix domain 1-containing protein [Clostridium tertium]MDB1940083.1 permease prefix domain 1-containing protein [Clostridium tertium]
MKIIDNYINLLYKDDDSIEVMELKEELKEHLILSANEFISQGYGEDDAYNKAIEKFDGGSDMLKELYLTLKEAKNKLEKDNISLKKTTNKIIYVCRTMFILFLLALASSIVLNETGVIENAQLKKWDALDTKLEENLSSIIQNKDIYDIDTYIDSVNELIKSENILMLRLYKDEYSFAIFSDESKDMIYEYGTKNVISYFDGHGKTDENNKGQIIYFRYKPDTEDYYKLNSQIRISILFSAPIIIIGYVIIELLARKNKSKSN